MQRLGHHAAEAQGFGDRSAGHSRHMHDKVALLELGHEGSAEERQGSDCRCCEQDGCRDQPTRAAGKALQKNPITFLGPAHGRRLAGFELAPRDQGHRHGRRDRQRDNQRRENRDNVSGAQGSEQRSGQT